MHTRVGRFERALAALLFFGATAAAALTLLGGGRAERLIDRRPSLELWIRLSEAYGLKRGSAVHIAGVEAGVVRDVTIANALEGVRVEALLSIDGRFRDILRRGTLARVRKPPVFGETSIDLVPAPAGGGPAGEAERPLLADGDRIAAVAPERLEEELAAAVRDLREATRLLVDRQGTAGLLLADEGRLYRAVDEAIQRTAAAAEKLERAAVDISRAAKDIPALVEEARVATERANEVVGAAKKSVFIRGNLDDPGARPREVEVAPRPPPP